ncbi:IS630 family transposase (plasmid) [Deinococcus taeanensis]|uniref:IS630 family transposase n=1 Tax=Deinococcus taeanensis TaxID=2737050 RepID=UPI001CDBF7D7|nr:IS630 family transposase [Deinococcus taeanensis]UBV45101.1 IS630 family transposase [Deinococcus taeanensis]
MNSAGVRGYAIELRTRIVALVEGGASPDEAARHFSVHVSTVKRYLARHRAGTLHVVARPTGPHRTVTADHEMQLLAQLETHRDATLQEHADMLEASTGVRVSYKTVDRVFQRHHITHKKTMVARERSEERRRAFLKDLRPLLERPDHLVLVDERGVNTAMTRGYARASRQERAVGVVPRNHGRNYTLMCALSLAGPLAPFVLDGAVTGECFEFYVAQELCPLLRAGQVVIMDNRSSHHRASIRTLVEEVGCHLLYLPPYSPDFNPIEWLFSQLKARLRGEARRTVKSLMQGIADALKTVSGPDIHGWFLAAFKKHLL